MPNLTFRTIAQTFALCTSLDAKAPTAAHKAWHQLTAAADAAAHLDTRNDLAERVVEALEAGRDPFTDPAVAAAATREAVNRNRPGIDAAIDDRAQTFLDEHAVGLVTALRKPFASAADTLTDALDKLGDVDLADAQAVVVQAGTAAQTWVQATAALRTIEQIQRQWLLLSQLTSSLPTPQQTAALVIVDPDPGQWLNDDQAHVKRSAWDLLRAGYRLDLATPDTFRDRLAGIGQEQTRRRDSDSLAERRAFADSGRRGALPRPAA